MHERQERVIDPPDDNDSLKLKRGFVIEQNEWVLTPILHVSAI
jgi:hypothetical protein